MLCLVSTHTHTDTHTHTQTHTYTHTCTHTHTYIYIFIYLFIYLFIRQIPNSTTAGSTCINAKEREKKERQVRRTKMSIAQRMKPTPTRAIDALIADEEQNGKLKSFVRKCTYLEWVNNQLWCWMGNVGLLKGCVMSLGRSMAEEIDQFRMAHDRSEW